MGTKKMWYIHTMKYSAFKKKEILSFAATWMKMGDFIVTEIRWHRKTNTACSHLYMGSQTDS
jgi:hypothetical protein